MHDEGDVLIMAIIAGVVLGILIMCVGLNTVTLNNYIETTGEEKCAETNQTFSEWYTESSKVVIECENNDTYDSVLVRR